MQTGDELHQRARIGILTALPKEYAAMRLMLEGTRDWDAPGTGAGRRFLLGQIPSAQGGCHVVAVALLPDMGNNIAAISAALFLEHFPHVRHLIMCGIAGGVPRPDDTEHDVRLGDIVVSNRNGVVQYDLVKERPDGSVELRHPPRPPGAELLDAVRHLQAEEELFRRPWEAHLHNGAKMKKGVRPPDNVNAKGAPIDYPADPERQPGMPRVFHSTIAAANRLLKNPKYRDYLGQTYDVKAVEMESSGISDATWMKDQAGYLVVRGICDYCDENKGDVWQGAAAIAAAAFVRALVGSMHTGTEDHLSRRNPTVQQIVDGYVTPSLAGVFEYDGKAQRNFLAAVVVRLLNPSDGEITIGEFRLCPSGGSDVFRAPTVASLDDSAVAVALQRLMIDDGVQVLELKGQKIRLRANDQVTGALVFAGGALPNIRDIEELRADLSYSLPSGERVSKNVVLRSVREMPYDESIMGIVTCSEERKTAGPILGPKGGKHKGRERRPARGRADAPASSNIPVSTAKSTPSPASRLGPTNVAVNRITGKRIPVGTDLRLSDFGDDNHLWAELQLPWQEEPTDLGLVPILDGAVILPLPFVFLCHAKEDRDAVRGISDNLLMMRIITWMDEKDLLPGDRWKVEIDRAIEECDFFVVALSRSSCTKTGYVQREIKYAIEQMELRSPRSRFIVPVLLEPCEPPRDFGDLHWLRLWEPGSMEKLVASLSDPSALDSYGRTDWTIAGATDINAMSATFRITNKGAASVVRPTEYGWRGIQSSPTALELAESPREVKPTSSTRHTRIVHISDLHLDPAIDFSADLQPLVNDLEEFAPHAILISGDITDRPSNDSLRMAESYVCRLKSFCEVVVLVPGNHDVDLPNRGFTLPFPHNRGTASFKEVFDFRPVQYFEALQLAVFSLDSNSSDTMRSAGGGIIGSQQLRDLSDNWDELALEHGDQFATSVKIVLLHHHPLPIAQPGSLVGDREQALHDAGKLRRILDEKRIDLVLHGHRHGAHFLSTTNPAVDPAHLVTIIGAGSALATGNSLIMESSYNRLTLMPTGKIVLDRRKRELAGFITADTCTWDRAGRNP